MYFSIGIFGGKYKNNLGTLWRSAYSLGASFIFIIGDTRYKKQPSDTFNITKKIPIIHHKTFEAFADSVDGPIIAVENSSEAIQLPEYTHPKIAHYLLGCEDTGIPEQVLDRCDDTIIIPGSICYNVAVAGSIVLYDRVLKSSLDIPIR